MMIHIANAILMSANWTNIFWSVLTIFDMVLFVLVAIAVLYLLFFAIASMRYQRVETGITRKRGRFLIITTATSQDTGVENTIKSILKQDYDTKDYDMLVVGDNLTPLQSIKLAQYPITLMRTSMQQGTKSQALQYAMRNLRSMKIYDQVILIDPDETVSADFLTEVNKVLQTGMRFFQLHRKPLRLDNDATILANTMEEINNGIFRRGHVACGMPSALIGSAVALDFNWFKANVDLIDARDEEKSLEALLLRQKIFVDYIDEVSVYTRPTEKSSDILHQRQRWMDSKMTTLIKNIKQLLPALLHWNIDLADKLFQWIMIPRLLLMAIIIAMSAVIPFIYFTMALKWWATLLIVTFAFALATPDYIVTDRWLHSFMKAPILLLGAIYNTIFHNFLTQRFKGRSKGDAAKRHSSRQTMIKGDAANDAPPVKP